MNELCDEFTHGVSIASYSGATSDIIKCRSSSLEHEEGVSIA